MEIKKLEDVVAWLDDWIEETKLDLTEEDMEDDTTIKEFETIRKVILESIERHKVYTNALKTDIASKDKEIERLNKELERRKECYTSLKELMDTKHISIEDHNNSVDLLNKEIERLNIYTANQKKVNHDLVTKVTLLESEIDNLKKELDARGEEIKKLSKCIMNKNESINTGNEAIINLRKQIGAHEEENKRLTEKIMELKKERDRHMARVNDLRMELDCVKASKEKHEEAAHEKLVEGLRENMGYWRNKYLAAQDEIEKLDGTIEGLKKKEDDHGRAGFETYIRYIISEEEGKFKAELNRKFSEEVSKISQKRTEEELAKVKGVGMTNSGRYPWGAKTIRCTKPNDFHCVYGDDCPVEAAEKCKFAKEENSIPCGEDSIE